MNNKLKRKAFTIVELVIVIAVIAILAAVLIPTFSSIVKKAEESAYLQDRTNQQLQDLIEKLENPNYMTWEDFESILAEKLAGIQTNVSDEDKLASIQEQINAAIAALNKQNNGLTKDQIEAIIEKALEGQLTTAQVQAIVNAALGNNNNYKDKIDEIINSAIEELRKETGDTGITPEQMESAINKAIESILGENQDLKDEIKDIIEKLNNRLSQKEIEDIINTALDNLRNDDFGSIGEDQVHNHTVVIMPGKAATCSQKGLTEGKKCSECGEILASQQEIPELKHEFENGTCKNCQANHYICSNGTCKDINKFLTNQDLKQYVKYPNSNDAYYCKNCNSNIILTKGRIEKCNNDECEICREYNVKTEVIVTDYYNQLENNNRE